MIDSCQKLFRLRRLRTPLKDSFSDDNSSNGNRNILHFNGGDTREYDFKLYFKRFLCSFNKLYYNESFNNKKSTFQSLTDTQRNLGCWWFYLFLNFFPFFIVLHLRVWMLVRVGGWVCFVLLSNKHCREKRLQRTVEVYGVIVSHR